MKTLDILIIQIIATAQSLENLKEKYIELTDRKLLIILRKREPFTRLIHLNRPDTVECLRIVLKDLCDLYKIDIASLLNESEKRLLIKSKLINHVQKTNKA